MKISQNGLNLIKSFEGCRLAAYADVAGVLTIGYGHTKGVYAGMKITQDQADQLLIQDLAGAETAVNKYDATYHWNQNQFDALVSFAFNIGNIDQLTAKGTRSIKEISEKILAYNKAGGKVVQGLVNRRTAEKKLFDKTTVVSVQSEWKCLTDTKYLVGTENLLPGDILLKEGHHVAIYVGNGMISNCGHDERNKYSGGIAGDQSGTEYYLRKWYNAGWTCVLRNTNKNVATKLAEIAIMAAENNVIGYNQKERMTYYVQLKAVNWDPSKITVPCEADCSSSTAANIIATGYILGINSLTQISPSLTTKNIRQTLMGKTTQSEPATGQKVSDTKMLTIRKGSKGKGVKIWQVIVGVAIDGSFGPNTEAATKAFQKSRGLEVDGIVGPKTWKAGLESVE